MSASQHLKKRMREGAHTRTKREPASTKGDKNESVCANKEKKSV